MAAASTDKGKVYQVRNVGGGTALAKPKTRAKREITRAARRMRRRTKRS